MKWIVIWFTTANKKIASTNHEMMSRDVFFTCLNEYYRFLTFLFEIAPLRKPLFRSNFRTEMPQKYANIFFGPWRQIKMQADGMKVDRRFQRFVEKECVVKMCKVMLTFLIFWLQLGQPKHDFLFYRSPKMKSGKNNISLKG